MESTSHSDTFAVKIYPLATKDSECQRLAKPIKPIENTTIGQNADWPGSKADFSLKL